MGWSSVQATAPSRATVRPLPRSFWASSAAVLATLPFLWPIATSRVFYIRDLSLSFWGRYIWLRRALLSGEWPLWDPYVGAGQAAVADGLHQMFLLPALMVRLLGSEVIGFDLWVALPFPLAALGTWLFLARRFSAPAAALGSIAYALSGPIISTGNFPNMSWSVAFLPWTLWAVVRVADRVTPRHAGVLAVVVAAQALSGEPVTLFATLVVSAAYVAVFALPRSIEDMRRRLPDVVLLATGPVLGLMLAAIQLLPMAQAAAHSKRSGNLGGDFWSLHPLALLETVALHLFGDYYTSQSLATVPWMPLVNSGREPFFFSVYLGVPLLTLALFGTLGSSHRRWVAFWVAVAAVGVTCAFGANTPIYPFLKARLPLLGSFRFPVKYLAVCCVTISVAAAAGWDAIRPGNDAGDGAGPTRGRVVAITFALVLGVAAYAAAGACLYFPKPTVFRFYDLARHLHSAQPADAAEFLLRTLPRAASWVLLMSVAAAALLFLAGRSGRQGTIARGLLYVFIVSDLLVHAWGVNPAFERAYLAEPEWVARLAADRQASVYIGGKQEGTLVADDLDSSRGYLNPPGLAGSASRAALNAQAAIYPSAWRVREMLSYDLAVLWPTIFDTATSRFEAAGPDERARFLDRTGVRFRVLPERRSDRHEALTKIPYFLESSLFDWGAQITPRAIVVPEATVVGDVQQQIEALFQDGWNHRTTALVERASEAAGDASEPVSPFASLEPDTANHLVVNAGAGAGGGYLVVLDSYADDWHATVDGHPASIVRADGLFRAVRLVTGKHIVEFSYRPRAFFWGAAGSAAGLLVTLLLFTLPSRRP